MRVMIVGVMVLASAASVTGCGKPKPLKYEVLEKANHEVLAMYGKKTEPERLDALKSKIGAPHLVTKDNGMDRGTWFAIRDDGGGKKACEVLRVSGIDLKHGSLGFWLGDADKPADCGL